MASVGRSRSRRRGEGAGSLERDAVHSAVDHRVAGSLRKQASNSGILSHTLIDEEIRKNKSRQTSCVPMKKLIDEEFSKDANARHTSPGAVGRLMGLDSLPSVGTHSHHIYSKSRAHNTSACVSHDRYLPQRRTDEIPEVKDVFEVMDEMRVKATHRARNGNATSRFDATEKANLDFIRHKFMDAKRLSTDESLQMSEELNETLDALVSNKELLLEFLQKQDQRSPSSNANCITILKPSKRNQFVDADNIYSQDNGTESYFPKHSTRKPHAKLSSQSLKEDSGSLRQKLSRSSHEEISDKRACPTRIVVLKPSLEKAQDIEGSFALTHEIPHSDYRRHTSCQAAGMWSPYTEESMRQVSLGNPETVGHIKKGSREIAREITKQMRASRGGGNRKQVFEPDTRSVLSDESSQFVSSLTKLKTSETIHRSSELCDSWDSSSFNSSPAHSNESSVIKEAKKHLSSRWKKTHEFQHQAPENNGFSVLGDMFALSDQESPKGGLQRNGVPGLCSNPLGISSKDGWRGVAPSNSARSKSIPSSSHQGVQKSSNRKRTSRKNEFSMLKDVLKIGPHDSEYACQSKQRKSPVRGSLFHGDEADQASPDDEERIMIDHEVHVSSQKPTAVIDMPNSSEQTLAQAVDPGHELDGSCRLSTSSALFEQNQEPLSPAKLHQQMHQQPPAALDFRLCVPNLDNLQTQAEGIENHLDHDYSALFSPPTGTESPVGIDQHPDSDNQTLWIHPTGPESPMCSNNDDQPSPVSVLESSLDTEEVYSGDFEKISADLQGLRMQLQLLKTETTDDADADADADHLIASDDKAASINQPLPEMAISDAFRDEEERDFSFVLDMLTLLGIDAAYHNGALDIYCFSEYPAGPDIFDILENKYGSLILWPRSERMLLFDLTNAVIAEIMTSLVHHGSKGLLQRYSSRWDQEGFVEDVWQRVFQLRQEMDCNQADPLMMELERHGSEDGVDLVGAEMGRVLLEDLVEETVAELLGIRQSGRFCG